MEVDWSQQHCGVRKARIDVAKALMPDLAPLLDTFPEDPTLFTWDVRVHMLMPLQYPCIPNWHCDCVPKINGIDMPQLVRPDLPMYLWISGPPLTQFEHGYLQPKVWHRFTQLDRHRGVPASDFGWRGFIRAVHRDLMAPLENGNLRRHAQVYLDANTYQC